MADKSNWLEYWVDPRTWQFRGDFEGMYRDFEDPWECSKNVSELRRDMSLMILFRGRRFRRVLDIGCGLGAFTERLRIANGDDQPAGQTIIGVDISATAVTKARESYPQCRFEALDVTRDPLPDGENQWDLVLVSEIIWYILPQLRDVIRKIHAALSPSGILFIQQYFPAEQRFGLEFLRSPADLYKLYLEPAGFRREHEFLELLTDGQVQLISLMKATIEE